MNLLIAIHHWLYLLISIIGLWVVSSVFLSRKRADASQSWAGVRGKVIDSHVQEKETNDYDGNTHTSYSAKVCYRYAVGGEEFTGSRIAFGVKPTNKAATSEIVAKYPVDTAVMVYYDPEKPQEAVLERNTNSGWVQILLGIGLFFAGIYLAVR